MSAPVISLLIASLRLLSSVPILKNKKGPQGALSRTAATRMALATPGGAAPYRYQMRNKISHFRSHLPFPCAPYKHSDTPGQAQNA
jgi:hypothetical protein